MRLEAPRFRRGVESKCEMLPRDPTLSLQNATTIQGAARAAASRHRERREGEDGDAEAPDGPAEDGEGLAFIQHVRLAYARLGVVAGGLTRGVQSSGPGGRIAAASRSTFT